MALIHVLDKQTDEIIGTLDTTRGQIEEGYISKSIDNINTFEMVALDKFDILTDRNRLLVQDADGIFNEFIIVHSDHHSRNKKDIHASGSFIDLQTAKVIPPQIIGGATPLVALTLTLQGTEWQPGLVEYTGSIRSIAIENHTDPHALINVIMSTFELEIRYRVEISGNRIIGRYVDLVERIAGFEGKEIVFGKDLIGIKRVEDSKNIATALVGLGPVKSDGTRLEVYVEDKNALVRWGRKGKHLVRVYEPESSDLEMTVARLTTLTENELEKRIEAVTTYECQAVSLESVFGYEHEKIRLGQTNRIKDEGYTPPLYLESRIRETKESIMNQRVLDFKIGNYVSFNQSDLTPSKVVAQTQMLSDKVNNLETQNAMLLLMIAESQTAGGTL